MLSNLHSYYNEKILSAGVLEITFAYVSVKFDKLLKFFDYLSQILPYFFF